MAVEYRDYYETLGVARDANADDIKKQYRRLARKYHPDVSKETDAEDKFKQVKEAYEVLKDPEKRKAYDQMGDQWQAGQGFTPPPSWEQAYQGSPENTADDADFSEFFSSVFGQGRGTRQAHRAHRKRRGQDQHASITISLQDAYQGAEKLLQLQTQQLDPATGMVQHAPHSLKVKIPAGVMEGQQIRLSGQGGEGLGGGPRGDLYLAVHLRNDARYTAQGRDIYLNLPITPSEAALGASIAVPTLGGSVTLKIPEGAQGGQKMRLKGRGLPGNPAGDQYVVLQVHVPKPTTDEQRALYTQLAEQLPENPRSDWH